MILYMNFQEIKDLYDQLKNKYNSELNRLIVDGALKLPDNIDNDSTVTIESFINKAAEFDLAGNEITELLNLDVENTNKNFINWVIKYVTTINRPIKETMFLKKLSFPDFEDMANYCFENYVIKHCGNKLIDGAKDTWSIDNILILRKVILTIAEMYIIQYYSYDRTINNIKNYFGLDKEYGDAIINCFTGYEDRLWKYLIMRKIEKMQSDISDIGDNQYNI